MSKENVAKFVKAVAETPELNKKLSSAARTTAEWVNIASTAGFKFSKTDFIDFVSEMCCCKEVNEANAVSTLLEDKDVMSEQQLAEVAGAGGLGGFKAGGFKGGLRFSPKLFANMSKSFAGLGGVAASFVQTSGPSFVEHHSGLGAKGLDFKGGGFAR